MSFCILISSREVFERYRRMNMRKALWYRMIVRVSSASSTRDSPFSRASLVFFDRFERQKLKRESLSFSVKLRSSSVYFFRFFARLSSSISEVFLLKLNRKNVLLKSNWNAFYCRPPMTKNIKKLKKSFNPEISPNKTGKLITWRPSIFTSWLRSNQYVSTLWRSFSIGIMRLDSSAILRKTCSSGSEKSYQRLSCNSIWVSTNVYLIGVGREGNGSTASVSTCPNICLTVPSIPRTSS